MHTKLTKLNTKLTGSASAAAVVAATVASLASLATPAFAQVDEIVVTAQKREATLIETPVAVSVVGEEQIAQSTILNVQDLQILTPSLEVTQNSGPGVVSYQIRGIGTSSDNFALEPSVSVYVDGVYRARQAAAINDFIDLERVEVLRGPQATLYGRNSTAGVISYTTKDPEFEFGGEAALTYGNYDQKIAKGTVTGPLGEVTAFRLSGTIRERDGFFDNRFDGSDENNIDRWNARGALLFQFSDATEVMLTAERGSLDENCCVAPYLVNFGFNPAFIGALGGTITTLDPDVDVFDRVVNFDNFLETTIETETYAARLEQDLGFAGLTGIIAYNEFSESRDLDSDFLDLQLGGRRLSENAIEDFQAEVRLAGNTDRFDWVVGATYYDQDLQANEFTPYGDDLREFAGLNVGLAQGVFTLNPAGQLTLVADPTGTALDPATTRAVANQVVAGLEGAILGLPSGSPEVFFAGGGESGLLRGDFSQDTESIAAFAQVDLHVTERLTLTLGGRIAQEEQDYAADVNVQDAFSALNFVDIGVVQALAGFGVDATDPVQLQAFLANPAVPVGQAPGGSVVTQPGVVLFQQVYEGSTDPNQNPLLGLTGLQFFPPTDGSEIDGANREKTYEAFNVIASYDVTDTLSAYASFSTGYKPQGANLTAQAAVPAPSQFFGAYQAAGGTAIAPQQPFDPFFDEETVEAIEVGFKGRFLDDRLTTNFAFFDVTNDDFQAVAFDGSGFTLRNAGTQVVQGIELEGIFAPGGDLQFTYGWLHLFENAYEEYTDGPCPDTSVFPPLNTDVPQSCFVDGTQDLSGTDRNGSDDVVSLTGTWSPMLGQYPSFLRAEYYYRSDAQLNDDGDPRKFQEAFDIVNASAGIALPDERAELQLWIKNAFDTGFIVGPFSSVGQVGSVNTYLGDPRTYGATLRFNW